MATRPRGMRIGELVERSGTPKETIHFYLREGLLRKPKKTSKNMAYYDDAHVEQLRLIKRLRTESYLPLNVIKKVLKEGKLAPSAGRLDLTADLLGQTARANFEPLDEATLAEQSGLSVERIRRYRALGLLHGGAGEARYGFDDVRIAQILKTSEIEAGELPWVEERFVLLERHLANLVHAEVQHFFERVLAQGDAKKALELLRGGRETIGPYLALSRARRLRAELETLAPALEPGNREPFFYPLADQPATKSESAEVLVLLGHYAAALDHGPADRWRAEALLMAEHFDQAHALLQTLRGAEAVDPFLEALWATTLLVRIRESFGRLESSAELIGNLSEAFAAIDRARGHGATDLEQARIYLLLGRVLLATPALLGVHEQGRRDLEAAVAILDRLNSNDPVVRRLLLNALYFLGRALPPAQRAALDARAASLGQLLV